MTWRLHHGDCLPWLSTLDARSVDHVITDPPYEAAAHSKGVRARKGGGQPHESPLDFAPMTEQLRTAAAAHMARVARRWILVWCQVEAAMLWRAALEAGGAQYVRTGAWIKTDAQPQFTGDRPGVGYESIVIAHAAREAGKMRWNGGGRCAVWTGSKSSGEIAHQTVKPDWIMDRLVRDFTDRGDMICDPFAGSGSTGVAAIRGGRPFLGAEMDARYHAVATSRLLAAREQMELLP